MIVLVPVIGFILFWPCIIPATIFWELFCKPEEERIREKIEKLKRRANENGIPGRVSSIASYLGNPNMQTDDGIYTDTKIKITRNYGNYIVRIPNGKGWKTVFECGSTKGSPGIEQEYYYKSSGDEYLKATRTVGGSSGGWAIKSYIPGKWEKHVHNLFSKSLKKQKEMEELQKKRQLKEQKEKFGL